MIQTTDLKFEGIDARVNHHLTRITVRLIMTHNAATIRFSDGVKVRVFNFPDIRLLRHAAYSISRATADVTKTRKLIEDGSLGAHSSKIDLTAMNVSVSGGNNTVSTTLRFGARGVTIEFSFGRKKTSIHIDDLNLSRFIGAVTGGFADSTIASRRYA